MGNFCLSEYLSYYIDYVHRAQVLYNEIGTCARDSDGFPALAEYYSVLSGKSFLLPSAPSPHKSDRLTEILPRIPCF